MARILNDGRKVGLFFVFAGTPTGNLEVLLLSRHDLLEFGELVELLLLRMLSLNDGLGEAAADGVVVRRVSPADVLQHGFIILEFAATVAHWAALHLLFI